MKITSVIGREVYDSRGWPTVQCDMQLDGHTWVSAIAPAGLSRGKHEACELRDGGRRLWGRGVMKAIEQIEYVLGPALMGKYPDARELDRLLLELDGTQDKSHLGGNTLIAVSMALYRAQACAEDLELFELIAHSLGLEHISLPFPQINVINGGLHGALGKSSVDIQEFLMVPIGMNQFRAALELGAAMFHELKALFERHGRSTAVGDEGGFSPKITIEEGLLSLCESMERTSANLEVRSVIGLDMAASYLFDPTTGLYEIEGQKMNSAELVAWYSKMLSIFPIFSLEDPCAEDDWDGWQLIMKELGDRIQIVGDDLTVTNRARIQRAVEQNCLTAVVIKPNQIGTVSQTLDAITYCRENGINSVVSHRSGETCDTFIADLAVGSNAGQVKFGSVCRGERIAKYNRLLEIEDNLFLRMMH